MDLNQLVLLCATLIFALCLVSTTVILYRAITAAGPLEPAIFGRLGGEGNALRIAAVFVVIVAVFYLAVAEHIDTSVTTILSGVAGFAFGGFQKKAENQSNKQSKEE